jgi:hypothetical protein
LAFFSTVSKTLSQITKFTGATRMTARTVQSVRKLPCQIYYGICLENKSTVFCFVFCFLCRNLMQKTYNLNKKSLFSPEWCVTNIFKKK